MGKSKRCPFSAKLFKKIIWTSICQLQIIERHVHSTTTNCLDKHPPLNEIITTNHLIGSNPLLIACCSGDVALGAIKIMIDKWGMDVNATGTYNCYNEEVQEVSPLFVAAACGHLKLVKYLVEKGANVNARTALEGNSHTFAGLLPIHAACWGEAKQCQIYYMMKYLLKNGTDLSAKTPDGQLLWEMFLYDANLTNLLIDFEIDLTQVSTHLGGTILHWWAGKPHTYAGIDVFRNHLVKGAVLETLDECSLTPLNISAISNAFNPTVSVFNNLLNRDHVTLLQRIEALELAGSTLILSTNYEGYFDIEDFISYSVTEGFQLWNEAMDLRNKESIAKNQMNENDFKGRRTVEWSTKEQLLKLQESPSEYILQAILVRGRILSKISSKALPKYLWRYVEYYLSRLLDHDHFAQLLEVCWIMLEVGHNVPDQHNDEIRKMIIKVITILAFTLQTSNEKRNHILNSDVLCISLELIVAATDRFHLDRIESDISFFFFTTTTDDHMEIMCKLISILAGLSENVRSREVMCCLYQLVRQDTRNEYGRNLLLTACDINGDIEVKIATIRLLIQLGANVNAVDDEKNNPLHIVAAQTRGDDHSPTAHLLITSGTHYDQVNKYGYTALDIWKKGKKIDDSIPTWVIVPKLVCLCAQKILCAKQSKSFNDNGLPKTLLDFILLHSPQKR